jgi:Family of unknown function (DUF6325)
VTGPVQVLVVGFDQPVYTGDVMAELERLRRAGTVRLLDVLVVTRTEDGTFDTLPAPAGAPPGMGTRVAGILGGSADEVGSAAAPVGGPTWSLADAIPVGATAAVALIEHLWATPLREAIHRAGGKALDETWLAQQDVERLDHLIAQADI